MIGLRLTVPVACWRKGRAREFWETETLPPPATCYGALLSFVGEVDRRVHEGSRVTSGLLNQPHLSTVLRTLWKVKDPKTPQGNSQNARPDLQQLWCQADLMIWCDSSEESGSRLEDRIREAFIHPERIQRFGGWSLGESTHLINDAWLIDDGVPPTACRVFLEDPKGSHTLPVWVDHVGMAGTRYAVGNLVDITSAPSPERLPRILAS
ncbi:type I-MYXAN CRISPR-associated protein Cas5/Cmx5/DevS [Geothrix sp. 21YS21S-4]|uniref:type I-MYXAN CRISPR-associated protein Cas5/Cmx5/DevS n=1 Tax=Geothrix sp. 21YS21S-4 TaxID=3068889 RepID=UPI0027B980FB|nr:type I-MYXAN CRISPR-associated protein Cas5/Cmx5/DevS [Geothrix sp. 21YS21S-4]